MDSLLMPTSGEILITEFLEPNNATIQDLITKTEIKEHDIQNVVSGKRPIDEKMAIQLSKFFGNSVNLWLKLQRDCDLRKQGRYDILNAGIAPLPESVPSS